jgi:hypothetical protein
VNKREFKYRNQKNKNRRSSRNKINKSRKSKNRRILILNKKTMKNKNL